LDRQHSVELLASNEQDPNPGNPYRMTPEERFARFIQILAEVHREMKGKGVSGLPSGSPILP
jgi:hypothetical protein